jgi:hypothetical protein
MSLYQDTECIEFIKKYKKKSTKPDKYKIRIFLSEKSFNAIFTNILDWIHVRGVLYQYHFLLTDH